ncbi:MAG: hypothetical protein HYZ75_18320 [Elusimicrobia bacterium]|nr:hypothetical protein [Elusimicrobiota bacterium]
MRRLLLLACLALAPATARAAGGMSADGRLSWDPGDAAVTINKRSGFSARGQKIALPALAKDAKRRVVFPIRGDRFAVLDAADDAVGLHQNSPRGARGALAVVTGATLRLLNLRGRVLWTKRLPETHTVGGEAGVEPLTVGADGSSALLLQDVDPYSKAKPFILVLDPKGKDVLRLDYTSWSRVDEMLLSDDGKWLIVRGIGRIPADDAWGTALGHYRLEDGDAAVFPTPKASGAKSLRAVDAKGWACCLLEGKILSAVDHDGGRDPVPFGELGKRFGVKQ